MNRKIIYSFLLVFCWASLYISCSKGSDPTPTPTPPVTPPPVTPPVAKTCIISGISQRNSGTKAEFGMTILYNNNQSPTNISIYDSVGNKSLFTAALTYATADSIRIDQYQYIKLDGSKRVSVFVTKSDLTDITNADNYRYEYVYNSEGYLATKTLFINDSKQANYTSTYSYSNNLLTGCAITATSSGNKKVLESTLSYDASVSPKTMIYTFPDAFENYLYSPALNFGNRPSKPLAQVITKLYNPANGNLLDTWTTNYSGYSLDSNGYLTEGTASGDLQQGMATFYGKTYFSYQCQ
jgi:YD repeat-containing protein